MGGTLVSAYEQKITDITPKVNTVSPAQVNKTEEQGIRDAALNHPTTSPGQAECCQFKCSIKSKISSAQKTSFHVVYCKNISFMYKLSERMSFRQF